MKERLDEYLAGSGRFPSRSAAKAAVMAGLVTVDGDSRVKPGTLLSGTEVIQVEQGSRFVSRGGEKLDGALDDLAVEVGGEVALDVGASTGGFTDCLLKRGASRVVALDVGKGQLHWKLRNDPRVEVIEGFNARYLSPGDIPGKVPTLATIDVSFISLLKVVGPVFGVIGEDGYAVALVKPQFEAGPARCRGGVVRDAGVHLEVLQAVREGLETVGLSIQAVTPSRLKGPKGNVEFFILVRKSVEGVREEALEEAVASAHEKGGRI